MKKLLMVIMTLGVVACGGRGDQDSLTLQESLALQESEEAGEFACSINRQKDQQKNQQRLANEGPDPVDGELYLAYDDVFIISKYDYHFSSFQLEEGSLMIASDTLAPNDGVIRIVSDGVCMLGGDVELSEYDLELVCGGTITLGEHRDISSRSYLLSSSAENGMIVIELEIGEEVFAIDDSGDFNFAELSIGGEISGEGDAIFAPPVQAGVIVPTPITDIAFIEFPSDGEAETVYIELLTPCL